jgi:Mrp family chromosome partitioning ATPase
MSENVTPTLAERLQLIGGAARRRWVVLVACVGIATAAALTVALGASKQYSSTAKLVLGDTQLVGVPPTTSTVPNPDPERDINTKVSLITAAAVTRAVNANLGLNMAPKVLAAKVQTSLDGTSNIVDVTVTDSSRARAMAIANQYVKQYVTFRTRLAQSTLRGAVASVQRQLSALGPAQRHTPQSAALTVQLRDLNLELDGQTGGALVVANATTAIGGSKITPAAAGLVGALVGLLLGIVAAALLELTDRRLNDGEQVAAGLGVRTLASVPRAWTTNRRSVLVDRSSRQTEAYDTLARQLILAGRQQALNSLIVTSPDTGDGKTSVTFGLARALARLDRRVLVIETDTGSIDLEGASGGRTLAGLCGVVNGKSTVAGEVVKLDRIIDRELGEKSTGAYTGGTISVLPSGSGECGSQRLLSRQEIADVISAGCELADFVVVDGPPAHRLHNALALVDSVDAALLVCRMRWTKVESLHHGVETVRMLGLRILGLVCTGASGGSTPVRTGAPGAWWLEELPASEATGNGHGRGSSVLRQQ